MVGFFGSFSAEPSSALERSCAMRWTPGGSSDDVEDRRDDDGGVGGVVVLFILSLIFKQNFFALLGGGGGSPAPTTVHRPNVAMDEAEKPLVQFVTFVLNDTQKAWEESLPQQAGVPYHHAKLVLFRDETYSGCGGAEASTGPFYCPADEKVYIDLSF